MKIQVTSQTDTGTTTKVLDEGEFSRIIPEILGWHGVNSFTLRFNMGQPSWQIVTWQTVDED